jgi:glycosyltransferase involved in cell wall biosynthesis
MRWMPLGVKNVLRPIVYGAVAAIAFVILVFHAVPARVDSSRRRARGDLPRVIWGPTPLINIKYWSQSVKQYGFESSTFVYGVYPAFKREDFDRHLDAIGPRAPRLRFLAPYFAFAWCLRNADVFAFFFDGGYLAHTPLRWLECQLLRLAGKQTMLMPYGSDIAVPGTLGAVEAAIYESYPDLLRRGPEIRRRVLYFSRQADFVVRCMQAGFMPRQDLIWPNYLAIDTEQWKPVADARGADPRDSEVVVVHPSNHRAIKGTEFLIKAVDELREEGLPLRLEIIEGKRNDEVRAAMARADIVGEQFIGGYGLTAVEAMSIGRPVISNLSWLGPEFWEGTCLRECPIVNASTDTLESALRRLAGDASLRDDLGEAGRQYVLKYHSTEAVGRIWAAILRHLWLREPIAPKVNAQFASSVEAG